MVAPTLYEINYAATHNPVVEIFFASFLFKERRLVGDGSDELVHFDFEGVIGLIFFYHKLVGGANGSVVTVKYLSNAWEGHFGYFTNNMNSQMSAESNFLSTFFSDKITLRQMESVIYAGKYLFYSNVHGLGAAEKF